jgi:hypothetical protein
MANRELLERYQLHLGILDRSDLSPPIATSILVCGYGNYRIGTSIGTIAAGSSISETVVFVISISSQTILRVLQAGYNDDSSP